MLCVGVLGLNFKTADLGLRESIARAAQSLADERAIFFRYPVVVLSTCNRTEIYFSAYDLAEAQSHLLAHFRLLINEPFEHRFYSYFGIDCFAHLCRVTAGLDSAILAETEIQRQVKVAYGRACELTSLPGCLHYAFQKALKVGKTIRSKMGYERGAPSLYGVLWQLADWKQKRILLVGYSEINRGFASFLMHKGIGGFSLCTRNPGAVQLEGVHVFDRKILDRWQEFDRIVCASKAKEYLVKGRGNGGQEIFDLSVPRNVDPSVGETALLYNIDQLIEQRGTAQHLEKCESLLLENVVKLARIYRTKTRHALGIVETG